MITLNHEAYSEFSWGIYTEKQRVHFYIITLLIEITIDVLDGCLVWQDDMRIEFQSDVLATKMA